MKTVEEFEVLKLKDFLEKSLLSGALASPRAGESEPSYTARVILPFLQSKVLEKTKSPKVWFRGDGAALRAFSSSFLGLKFHPDVALGEGRQKLWCLEVKLIRSSLSGDVVTKALGQALVYKNSFQAVTILLVNVPSGRIPTANQSHPLNEWLNVLTVDSFS